MGAVNRLIEGVEIPLMAQVAQLFDNSAIEDVPGETRKQLGRCTISGSVRPGMSVAVAVGSRGIDRLADIVQETVKFLQLCGARPFIVPAMGSHGGARAEGQRRILADYGIDEERMGVPVLAGMEVETVGEADGRPVFLDRNAAGADGIVVINRVKPHTAFRGACESGLMKMLAVGLGKQKGAQEIHRDGLGRVPFHVERAAAVILQRAPVLFGVATVENAYDRACQIEVLAAHEIPVREPALLCLARERMPRLLFERLDLLIVDRIGKNISGSGMDPNITHTFLESTGIDRSGRARRITVLDLTGETHGAAVGIGAADTTTRRVLETFDFEATYPNCLTTGVSESSRIPMVFDSQKLAIQAAIRMLPGVDPQGIRAVRIRDTLHLGQIQISGALLEEARQNPNVRILSAPAALPFDREGNLF